MNLLSVMLKRRSIRQYTNDPIPAEKLNQIIQAGLLSPSGRNRKPWEFVVVQNPENLKKLAQCRSAGAKMLENAKAAIIVIGNPKLTDVWTEDCSIAMCQMHLMADYLGIGSCWIQGRLREAADGRSTEDYVKELLAIPDYFRLEAILSLGIPKEQPKAYTLEELRMDKVHYGTFGTKKE